MSSHSDRKLRIHIKNKPKKSLHVPFKAKERLFVKEEMLEDLKFLLKNAQGLSYNEHRLQLAVCRNDTDLILQLLEKGVNPNVVDIQQRSTLHVAVKGSYTDVVRILLQYHADPNAQDITGNTPLHLAACMNNLQIITLLLNAGADVGSLDLQGRNPLQLAKSKLEILEGSWKAGAIEMTQLRDELQQIVDMMISMWRRKDLSCIAACGYNKDNIDDLEMIKLSINSGPEEEVDDQMSRLQKEL